MEKQAMGREAVVRKIEALLAKANSTTFENEAQQAMLMAQKLMAKYGVEESALAGQKIEYEIVICKTPGNKGFRGSLSVIIGRNFRCRPLYYGNDMAFFGRKEDTKVCKAAYEFAYNFGKGRGDAMVAERRKAGKATAQVFNPYITGFLKGLQAKLDEQCKALMIVVPQDVDVAMKERFTNMRNDKSHGMKHQNIDMEAFKRGFEDGKTALNRAIE